MSVRTHGVTVLFGIPKEIPKLPNGFEITTNKEDWVFATKTNDMTVWYVGKNELVLRGIANQEDVDRSFAINPGRPLKLGDTFYDNRHIIRFNPETGEVME